MIQMVMLQWQCWSRIFLQQPVHGIGGITGTLLAGVFASTGRGVFSGKGFAEGISSIAIKITNNKTHITNIKIVLIAL